MVAGNTATQSSVPVMGCPRDEAGEGCAGWAGGGVGPRPLQETRVLRPLTPGYRSGRPEGSEEGQGQQTTRECAGSGASQDGGGVQGFWYGTGWGRGPERGGGPRGGLSSQQGRSEGGAGRGGTPQRGPPLGTHMGTPPGHTRGPPWGRWRVGVPAGTPLGTHAHPPALCVPVLLSAPSAHSRITYSVLLRPGAPMPEGAQCPPLCWHSPWGLGSAAVRRPGHRLSETKPRAAGRSLALAIKFPLTNSVELGIIYSRWTCFSKVKESVPSSTISRHSE